MTPSGSTHPFLLFVLLAYSDEADRSFKNWKEESGSSGFLVKIVDNFD